MTTDARFRPRRSCLYVPGANARAMEKARSLPADALILDLEDAVAPDAKAAARDAIVSAVRDRAYGVREVVIRVNGLDTDRSPLEGADKVFLSDLSKDATERNNIAAGHQRAVELDRISRIRHSRPCQKE